MPGRWNFPGGGVDPGESVQAAAYRELAEEAGFSVPQGSLRWAFSYRRPGGLTHIFWVCLDRRPPVTMPDGEHDRYCWTRLPSIPIPVIPGVNYVIRHLTGKSQNLGFRL
jgi:8-oxo-dGTP pyrophosphatase MutT (NUDIX family)